MSTIARIALSATFLALAASAADAQRSRPRAGVAVEPEPRAPSIPYPGANVYIDPRVRTAAPPTHDRRGRNVTRRQAPTQVVYVIPVPVGDGDYGYGYGYPAARAGGVYDTQGRPLSSSIGAGPGPSAYDIPSYTPDLSGSPFVVIEGGAMMVDYPTGERRTFPSCAAEDPDGRPRTVFYDGGSAGLVLRAGQRGRVQGQPDAGVKACYAVDAYGRIALAF